MSELRVNKILNVNADGPVQIDDGYGIKIGVGASIQDLNGNELIDFVSTTNAVNEIRITNAATGSLGPLIDVNGETDVDLRVGAAGTGNITLLNQLKPVAGTTTVAPIHLTSGTNLTTPIAGAIEYDGVAFYATPSTSLGRGSIPVSTYTSGAGTAIAVASNETTPVSLFPTANDTINLPVGTYYVNILYAVTRAASTTSARARLQFSGGGTAVGTFSGIAYGTETDGTSSEMFWFSSVALTVNNLISTATATSGASYTINVMGILNITTEGSIIPQYSLNANLAAGSGSTTVRALSTMIIQPLDNQSAGSFGPVGAGWT